MSSISCEEVGEGREDAAGVAGAPGLFLFPSFLKAVPVHAWLLADAAAPAAFIPEAHTGKAIS